MKMSFQDWQMVQNILKPEKSDKKPDPAPSKSDIETYLKIHKKLKKLEEKEKEAKKNEKPKEEKKKSWWDEASILQKMVILTALVPVVFTVEFLLPIVVILKILGFR